MIFRALSMLVSNLLLNTQFFKKTYTYLLKYIEKD